LGLTEALKKGGKTEVEKRHSFGKSEDKIAIGNNGGKKTPPRKRGLVGDKGSGGGGRTREVTNP